MLMKILKLKKRIDCLKAMHYLDVYDSSVGVSV